MLHFLKQNTFATDSADFRKHIVKKGKTMNTIINADAAKLAGLQAEPTEKFALLVDLGIITVPNDYKHENRLSVFFKKNHKKFYHFNGAIIDLNFPNPTCVLKPGDKLRVRVFKQVIPGRTTSEERMEFLATQKAVYVGAQGLTLVFEQKRHLLPKGKRAPSYDPTPVGKLYCSIDESNRLWKDDDNDHRVPQVICYSDGDFELNLGRFETRWYDDDAFLCFNYLESGDSTVKKYFRFIQDLCRMFFGIIYRPNS